MPGYDVQNGLASATPLVFVVGLAIVVLVGVWLNRRGKR